MPFQLDMITISAVAFSVTAILGIVLVFAWAREPTCPFIGRWGLAQLVHSAGILIAAAASFKNHTDLLTVGQAAIVLAGAIMWMAAAEFEGGKVHPLWILAWPIGFLIVTHSGYLETFDALLILTCSLLAILSFAAAFELSRGGAEWLSSRWPAIVLLLASGAGYLSWLPLTLTMPIRQAGLVFASTWFPVVILITLLGRVALAFIVMAMAKERQELKQRIDALTDPLTGLPNRRALFDAANEIGQDGGGNGNPISVLVFDLDHFKKINDAFGHLLGDRVLQLFAAILTEKLDEGSIVARLGGEEFAAILPGADLEAAAQAAEGVRMAFATSAAVIDGVAVAGTVSVGAACDDDIACDFNALFHRADGALYAAKSAGRNRVELVGPQEAIYFSEQSATVRLTPALRDGNVKVVEHPPLESQRHTRLFRRTSALRSPR